jgi:hypothetical protein
MLQLLTVRHRAGRGISTAGGVLWGPSPSPARCACRLSLNAVLRQGRGCAHAGEKVSEAIGKYKGSFTSMNRDANPAEGMDFKGRSHLKFILQFQQSMRIYSRIRII